MSKSSVCLGLLCRDFTEMTCTAKLGRFQDQTSLLKREQSPMLAYDEAIQKRGLDERQGLVNTLRGQCVRIPNLHSLFRGWPEATNSHIAALRTEVDQTLNKYEDHSTLNEP